MKQVLTFLCCGLIMAFSAGSTYAASIELIENGNFNQGLASWDYSGDVTVGSDGTGILDGNYAILGKNSSAKTDKLSQDFFIEKAIKEVTLSFDMVIEGYDKQYFVDDDVSVIFKQTICDLWDINLSETVYSWESTNNSQYNIFISYVGTLDVTRFITNTDPNASILFELDEDSGIFKDNTNTKVFIDDVSVKAETTEPVPEPATLFLLGSGLFGFVASKRRKK